jgi:hypothetical protein
LKEEVPTYRHDFRNITTEEGSNTFNISIEQGITSAGSIISLGFINDNTGLTGWHKPGADYTVVPNYTNIDLGTKIAFKPFVEDSPGIFVPPGLPITDYVIKGVVEDYWFMMLVASPGRSIFKRSITQLIHSVDYKE